jgi:hypothetical protein
MLFVILTLCGRDYIIMLERLRFFLLNDSRIPLFLFLHHFFYGTPSLHALIEIQRLLWMFQNLVLRYCSASFWKNFCLYNIIGSSGSPVNDLSYNFFLLGTGSNRVVFLSYPSSSIFSLTRVNFIARFLWNTHHLLLFLDDWLRFFELLVAFLLLN